MKDNEPDALLARPGQLLADHLHNVSRLAEGFSSKFNAGAWGRCLGLWHDIGKSSALFQQRVRGETERRVDHSTAGARQTAREYGDAGRVMSYAVAGHHGGLPDGKSNEDACLCRRLDETKRHIEDFSAWRKCLGTDDMPTLPTPPPFDCKKAGLGFRLAFFVRMLFSCLVDADRLDAEAVGDPDRATGRMGYPSITELGNRLDAYLNTKVSQVEPSPVNRIRAQVLEACREASSLSPGLFSLTVPTGGGKTLSSLAFALDHAVRHGLDRIVYVIPYTSIIEQNAAVFRAALGDKDGMFVVEHHSNFDSGGENDDQPHPATENWDAPVIVTTSVQFFESLYSHKAGRCRKLHNLSRSVVILDEAQMLPLDYLKPCLEALKELVATYKTSVVLCTATQPALNASSDSTQGLKVGLLGVREIIPDPVALHQSLRRVRVRHVGERSEAGLAGELAGYDRVLCIVNSRRTARTVFDALRELIRPDQGGLFHLSALMCPAHRAQTFARIRKALDDGSPCRVVSTTLVEAGVDVDFPVVFRAESGIDSIAQAAGRCNREGKLEQGEVFVFRPERGHPVGHFRRVAQAGRSVAGRHAADLLHPNAIRDYFLELYWQVGEDQLDKKSILERLTEGASRCWFPFREIGREFQLIESATQGVIIPYNEESEKVIRALRSLEAGDRAGGLMRRAQRFSVSLYERDLARLEREGAVERSGPSGQFFVLSNTDLYDPVYGLDVFKDDPGVRAPEDLFV